MIPSNALLSLFVQVQPTDVAPGKCLLQLCTLLFFLVNESLLAYAAEVASTVAFPPTIGSLTTENRFVPRLVPVYKQDFEGALNDVELVGSSVFVTESSGEVIAGKRSIKFDKGSSFLQLLPGALRLQPFKTYYLEFEYRVLAPGKDGYYPLAVALEWTGTDPASKDLFGPITGIFPDKGKVGRSFRIGDTPDATVSFFNIDSEVVLDNIVVYRHDSLATAARPQPLTVGFPRLLTYHIGSVGESAFRSKFPLNEVADTLALFDVIAGVNIDHTIDAMFSTRLLRERNPNLIILPYLSSFVLERQDDTVTGDSSIVRLFNRGVEESWYMRGPDGGKLEEPKFPTRFQMNHTRFAKQVDGIDWNAYVHHYVTRTVLPSGLWQGIFFDETDWHLPSLLGDTNGLDNINAPLPPIDLNEDGVAETEKELSQAWDEAFANYFKRLRREVGEGMLLYGNAGELPQRPSIYRWLNGMQRELTTPYRIDAHGNWVTTAMGGWFSLFERHRMADKYLRPPQMAGFQYTGYGLGTLRDDDIIYGFPEREAVLDPRDFRRMRLGLTSTMLNNSGFFGYNYIDAHSAPVWFDEYAVNAAGRAEKSLTAKGYLGQPLAKAEEVAAGNLETLFSMDFEGEGPPRGVLLGPRLRLTTAVNQVINGTQSAILEHTAGDPESGWIFSLDPNVLRLQAGALYQMSMRYRVLSQTDPYSPGGFVTVAFTDGGAQLDVIQRNATLWDTDNNQDGILRTGMLVERNDASAYGVLLKYGSIIVDDLVLMKGATAFRRDFENGIVLVNPSSVPIRLTQAQVAGPLRRRGIKRILGKQDVMWNNGKAVLDGITLPAADGIILLANRISAGTSGTITNIKVQVAGNTASLRWTASQGPVAGYVVRYGLAGSDLTQFAFGGPDASTDVGDLLPGKSYIFRMQSFDFLGRYGQTSSPVTVNIPGQATAPVTLTVISPLLDRVLTPGSPFKLTGTNLSKSTASASGPFPEKMGQTQVLVNGVAAGLMAVTPTEVSGFIPWNVTGNTAIVRVLHGATSSPALSVPFQASAPAVPTWDGRVGIALRERDQTPVLDTAPAVSGEQLILLATGLGAFEPLLDNGQRPGSGDSPLLRPVVRINGGIVPVGKITVFDAGSAFYSAIHFQVPVGIPPGPAEVVIQSGSERSVPVKLWFAGTVAVK
jgi:uncharacterized protein (TIGR03437 family)